MQRPVLLLQRARASKLMSRGPSCEVKALLVLGKCILFQQCVLWAEMVGASEGYGDIYDSEGVFVSSTIHWKGLIRPPKVNSIAGGQGLLSWTAPPLSPRKGVEMRQAGQSPRNNS